MTPLTPHTGHLSTTAIFLCPKVTITPFVLIHITNIVTYTCISSLSHTSLMGVNSSMRNSFCFSLLSLLLKLK